MLACQDWAATKAAYRFLDNASVNEAAILEGHFQATRTRFEHTLGLAAVKFWTRKQFKRTNALKRRINSTRVPTLPRK